MTAEVMRQVWDSSHADGDALLVALAIADCAGPDGRTGRVPRQYLAEKTRLSAARVERAIRRLVAGRELLVEDYVPPNKHGIYVVIPRPGGDV